MTDKPTTIHRLQYDVEPFLASLKVTRSNIISTKTYPHFERVRILWYLWRNHDYGLIALLKLDVMSTTRKLRAVYFDQVADTVRSRMLDQMINSMDRAILTGRICNGTD